MPQGHEDDLFSPSLAGTRPERLPAGRRPWRLGSQFYVSVLGGPLAAGLVGFLNGQRLGLPRARLAAIAAIALAALAAVAVTLAAVSPKADSPVRLVSMVGGAAAYVAIRALQTDADRRYTAGRDGAESYDSLWLPGLGIVVAGSILAAMVIVGVTE
jgi:hypothetical protein